MNLIDIEDRLKDLSDQQLMQQMQRPDGMAPQFLVMSELKRRKEMRGRAPTQPDTSTVKDDLLGQGIASAMPQQPRPQQPMDQGPMPQDGIPRFDNGWSGHTPYNRLHPNVKRRMLNIGRSGFDLSAEPLINKTVPAHVDPAFGTASQRVYPSGYADPGQGFDFRPRGGTYDSNLGLHYAATDDEQTGMGGNDTSYTDGAQGTTRASTTSAAEWFPSQDVDAPPAATSAGANNKVNPRVAGLKMARRGSPPYSGGYDNQYGEVDAASDNQRMIYQFLSAPSATSDAPAAPAQNYYEGIEKKLAALQAAETGPDAGMALLRAGLGMAEAGGKGESTAAAIGAGGIAGLDAYEAQKKASDARAMQLLGVESELAGAKTKQSYDQQRLALDARMRDNQDKMLQLKGLGLSMEDKRVRDLAASSNQLKNLQIGLEEYKINMDADIADRKLSQLANEGKIKGNYYEALIRKADRGDSLDRYMNASPEERALLLPLLRKNSASLQDDIGKDAMKLVADPLWFENTSDRLKKAAGGGEIGINAVIMEARRQAEIGYGQGGGAPQAPRDSQGIR